VNPADFSAACEKEQLGNRVKVTPEAQIKSKVVSFRISDDEYESVETASQKHGFASVSLFARAATLKGHSFESVHTPMDVELNRLWRRIEALTSALEQIAARLGASLDRVRVPDETLPYSLS
jgi:hypothetical protein